MEGLWRGAGHGLGLVRVLVLGLDEGRLRRPVDVRTVLRGDGGRGLMGPVRARGHHDVPVRVRRGVLAHHDVLVEGRVRRCGLVEGRGLHARGGGGHGVLGPQLGEPLFHLGSVLRDVSVQPGQAAPRLVVRRLVLSPARLEGRELGEVAEVFHLVHMAPEIGEVEAGRWRHDVPDRRPVADQEVQLGRAEVPQTIEGHPGPVHEAVVVEVGIAGLVTVLAEEFVGDLVEPFPVDLGTEVLDLRAVPGQVLQRQLLRGGGAPPEVGVRVQPH